MGRLRQHRSQNFESKDPLDERARPLIVLASSSPRRRELLASIGVDFEVRPSDIDEAVRDGEAPADHVRRLALEKAAAVGAPGELVIAADTIVVVDGDILGKPRDDAEGERMLARIQGREHRVLTGVALREVAAPGAPRGDRTAAAVAESEVRLRSLRPAEIAWYLRTGEPADKAGAYALQGIGGLFVEAIRGSSSNVVGLPMSVLYDLFPALGYDLRDFCTASSASAGRPRAQTVVDTLPPT
jgi:septum formation protein